MKIAILLKSAPCTDEADRALQTASDMLVQGHDGMMIGLSQFRDLKKRTLLRLLILPFVGDPGRVPINRH